MTKLHPAQRFKAPATIETGASLADMLDTQAIKLISESFAAVHPDFNTKAFRRDAAAGLDAHGIMQRGNHIAQALAVQLPEDPAASLPLIVASLGPPLATTEGNGLAPFFYLPHSAFIAQHAETATKPGMAAMYELTQRFTAEFCIRPYLAAHPKPVLAELKRWTKDPNPHVRRLVSEGTRPRLPWGMRLKVFIEDPAPLWPLLEKLKDDPELYVRRSVANHLGDLAKDHLDAVLDLCEKWLAETKRPRFAEERAHNRRWLIRHALRHPAKKGDKRALELRSAAK